MGLHERFSEEQAWGARREPGIRDGVDVERAILGSTTLLPEKDSQYLSFQEAITLAKEHQPNLFERSKLLKDLRTKIAEYSNNKMAPIKFFTAVGTPLDIYHGIDGFFEQGGNRATLDISLREKSMYKADVLLVVNLDEEGAVSINEEELKDVAAKIASKLDASSLKQAA